MANRIPIHVSNHTAFVWDVDHIATLRSEHRICGVLTGTLPHLSQQNVFLGLPLVLTPEELVLLVEKQLAIIVHDPAAHHTPTPSQLEAWDASRRQDITNQIALLEHRKAEAEDRATATSTATATTGTPATIQQKRAEREARRRQLAEQAAAEAGADADADSEEGTGAIGGRSEVKRHVDAPAPVTPTTATTSTTSNAIYTISVPTTSDTLAWYDSNNNGDDNPERHTYTYETLDAARAAHVWNYPSNAEERARCEVFRDLWEKGYYMGGGSKFGGDWLVYPGDPLRYHSHFVATVQTSPSAPLRPMEVVAHGRLGTATKKAHLLCGWDPESREVTYFSIEWAGFG
ncbi:hypothetical protein BGY98DRAFT_73279 [Russula aff. rugulosa BPL654]|nr:hypothetical protein BGY98DRAFT_73279 [Russula aff. rugulosa BPL654]